MVSLTSPFHGDVEFDLSVRDGRGFLIQKFYPHLDPFDPRLIRHIEIYDTYSPMSTGPPGGPNGQIRFVVFLLSPSVLLMS
jgi:hypothetical protein